MIARALLVGLATAVLVPLQANAQDLVQEALDRGTKSKKCEAPSRGANLSPGGIRLGSDFDVEITGPLNRVECRAALAARNYQAVDRRILTEEDTSTFVRVRVRPGVGMAGRGGIAEWGFKNVILKSRAGIVQPDSLYFVRDSIRNDVGIVTPYSSTIALFRPEVVPAGEFEVLMTYSFTELKVRVPNDARRKIR